MLMHRVLLLQELDYMKRPEVKIVIPDPLKLQLVDDWENVTKNNQVSMLILPLDEASHLRMIT
jgi:hypothetical protein